MRLVAPLSFLLLLVLMAGCRRGSGTAALAPDGTPSTSGSRSVPQATVPVPADLLPPASQTVNAPQPSAGRPTPGLTEYLEGIEHLEAARWAEAAAAFGQAADADGDNATYHTARGVAHTLAEQYPQALAELQRALRLQAGDFDAKLWLAAAFRMSGDPAKGAQYYSAGDAKTKDYASLVYNDMAMEYWQSKTQGQYFDKETRQMVPVKEPVRRKFPEAGAWFAKRAKAVTAGQDLTLTLFARARQRYDQRDYAAALEDLEQVRPLRPEDLDVLYFHAGCKLGLGDAATARREYTRLLTSRTNLTAAYLGRGSAAAQLGDAKRARADLTAAAALDAPAADRLRPDIEKAIQAWSAGTGAAPPAEFAAVAMNRAAQDGASWKTLVERAQVVHKIMDAGRLHYDEAYQDRLKALEDAARHGPNAPERWVDLGKFLYDQSDVFGERVEPRGPPHRYRYQTAELQKAELTRAEKALDQALKIDPKHLRALVAKAVLCFDQGRYDETETLLKQALQAGPNDPEMLYLFSELRKYGAGWRAARAGALRSPDVWSTQSREGDYIVTRTYTRNPSDADLRLANEYERESNQLYELARQNIEKALKVSAGTALGAYYQGLVHKWSRDDATAEQDFRQAIQLDPRLIPAHQELIFVLQRQGREDDRLREEAVLMNLVQTTAGPLLKLAWNKITKTAWGAAAEALTEAAKLDPADARIPAYRAVMAAAQGQGAEAGRQLQLALALEEARANRQGTTLQAGGSGTLDPADAGLTMELRNRLGQLLLQRGQAAEALELYTANAALETRLSRRDWTAEVYSAMVPDPNGEPGTVPVADNVVALLAWSRLGMGNCLLALKRGQEAEQAFGATGAYEPRLLATEGGRERLREPAAWAVFALCRLDLARRDPNGAFQRLIRWGNPPGLSARAREEEKKVEAEIDSARRGGR